MSAYPDEALSVTAAPRHANPADHPWFVANPVSHENIVATYDRATEDDKAQGHNWYNGAHLVAKAIAHGDAAKGAGLLAIYSPNTPWPVNMFNAASALERKTGVGGKGSGFFASAQQKASANRVLAGEHYDDVVKGPKIRDFAHLIEHNGDADPHTPRAVIDRHATSIAVGRRLSDDELDSAPLSTEHYYRHVVSAYQRAADILSGREGKKISAHQVQATTWLVQQRENALADAAIGERLERGRKKSQENAAKRWNEHVRQHYPDLTGPAYHHDTSRAAALLTDAAGPAHRRCEGCGGAMPNRMHRSRDAKGRLVCDSCRSNGFGQWNVAYAERIGMNTQQQDELRRREAEAIASITRMSAGTASMCQTCQMAVYKPDGGTWVHVDGRPADGHPVHLAEGVPMGWRRQSSRKVAHDSGDGETIYHCPFCGSGAVSGGSDGTVSCEYCKTHFTVQVQPEYSAMPQTVNGQPFNIPGMPGGGPDAGAATPAEHTEQDDAQQGQPGAPAEQDAQAPTGRPVPEQFRQSSLAAMALMTPDGIALDGDRFIKHLAIRFADPDAKDAVLAQVRAQNTRSK